MCRYNTTNPALYDLIRPTLLNPLKETVSVSDSESIPSPCTSPPQPRRHYGESITNLGKASIMGEDFGNRVIDDRRTLYICDFLNFLCLKISLVK